MTLLIGYWDEGTWKKYDGFIDYLTRPGFIWTDLVIWTGLFTLLAGVFYQFLARNASLTQRYLVRAVIAVVTTTVILPLALILLFGMIRMYVI